MGDFADLLSKYLVGHSAGVAQLAGGAAQQCGFPPAEVVAIRRAALVHDVGRVGTRCEIWQKAAALTPDEWEQVRLHAYHTERVLSRSRFSRDSRRSNLPPRAAGRQRLPPGRGRRHLSRRLLPARGGRRIPNENRTTALQRGVVASQAADLLGREVRAGRLDANCVAAVLEVAGQHQRRLPRPAGLTEREAEVVGLLARGLQTKQVARALGISIKTADRHVQNAYAKIGVSTRAAATVFAMQHGLAAWGELLW